jgi:4-hydroxy-tetrahydrodipicolinate synthase
MSLVQAVQNGDAAEARRLNERLEPLWSLLKEFSSLRLIYVAAGLLGICRARSFR